MAEILKKCFKCKRYIESSKIKLIEVEDFIRGKTTKTICDDCIKTHNEGC